MTRYARLHKPRMSLLWWLDRPTYTAFVLRELSSIFVAWSVAYLLWLVFAVAGGSDSYQRFLDRSASPWLIALNALTLGFLLYHAITFINLTPQAMTVRWVSRPALYLMWIVISAALAWLVMN